MTSLLKNKRSKPPQKKTVDVKLSTISVIVGILVVIGATTPFWNIWFVGYYPDRKVFGFKNITTFLYSFGNHYALFCCAVFVFWVKNFIDPQYRKIIKIINVVGGIFLAISVYFLLWVFSPASDFPQYVYEIAFIILAVFITYGVYLLNNFVVRIVLENKYNVRNLTAFIFRIRNKYFFPMAVEAINKENREKIEKDIDKFDEEVFETLDDISK